MKIKYSDLKRIVGEEMGKLGMLEAKEGKKDLPRSTEDAAKDAGLHMERLAPH